MTDCSNNSDRVPGKDNGGVAEAPVSVLVVGAGPTGLLLALELERRGVRCHLIDARPGPLHWDRATVVHPRSLQIFGVAGTRRGISRCWVQAASDQDSLAWETARNDGSRPAEAFMDSISACLRK